MVRSLEGIKPNWRQYYQEKVYPLGDRAGIYRTVAAGLQNQNRRFLDPRVPKTFLLGGFHPRNGTPSDFMNLCDELHPNPQDSHIFIDMNAIPFRSRKRKDKKTPGTRAHLEQLPFADHSIDIVILDGTLDYLSAGQVYAFGREAARTLTRSGIVLGMRTNEKYVMARNNDFPVVPLYPHSDKELVDLLPQLKPVFLTQGSPRRRVFAFARHDSDFMGVALPDIMNDQTRPDS